MTPTGSPAAVALVGDDLVITSPAGRADLTTIRLQGNGYSISDSNPAHTFSTSIPGSTGSGTNSITVPLAAFTGVVRVQLSDLDDTLTVDYIGGDLRHSIIYDGGGPTTAPGDALAIIGGEFATITGNYVSKDSGDLVLRSAHVGSPIITVAYTGLEPVLINVGSVDDIVFNLPAAGNNANLGDDGTIGNSLSRLSGPTFELTDFTNPTSSLTINRGAAADTITIAALPDFDRTLTLGSAAAPFAAGFVRGTLNLAGTASFGLFADGIEVARPITTTGGPLTLSAAGDVTIRAPIVTNGGNQVLKADSDGNGSGTFTLDLPIAQLVDPNPAPGNFFGAFVLVLTSGSVVVTSQGDDFAATNAGAVYLFNGLTGQVISTLRGSSTNDSVGNGGATALNNGNYVVRSTVWDNGAAANAGAVTWGSGTAGVSGVVSAANSLVGSTISDNVGNGLTLLSDGNYVVSSPNWDNGAATNAGAVTWGSGAAGVSGVVSAANSLVGSTGSDSVGGGGGGVTALSNGNYVVRSPVWDNGAAMDAGAVTWGSGAAGVSGIVSATNSLVGSTGNDSVGSGGIAASNAVTALSNGNYVVSSPNWDNGAATNAGAVTWGSGTAGLIGVVSAANSLVGSIGNDSVGGGGVTALSNGNYLALSPNWDNGAATDAGAVTWGSGTAGASGVVSAANSLVGSTGNDSVGGGGVTVLSNGNYVVGSPNWDNGAATDAGAVTWGSGTAGVSGVVSAVNSLVGSTGNDSVGGGGVTILSSGNYVVRSTVWDNGAVVNAGAVTWGSGTAGVSGVVSAANSLVGLTGNDSVGGGGVTILSSGNYVVRSTVWDNGAAVNAGAATWGSGTAGVSGVVSTANSLVGSKGNDLIGNGGVTVLSNGNYVVRSTGWNNGLATSAGAVTWGSGTAGVSGVVSAANSLVGSKSNDSVGNGGVTPLNNGNYVVSSPNWDNGATMEAGAVTWGSGTAGVSGVVSAANSLVGSTNNDSVGSGDSFGSNSVTALSNGNYVVRSPRWRNGALINAGAVTWGSGTAGVSGVVSAANSLVGSTGNDSVGSGGVTVLSNGAYVARSPAWNNGASVSAGAVTWGSGTVGVSGVVSAANSLVGSTGNDSVGSNGVNALSNGNYVVISPNWDNGAATDAGAVTWGSGTAGVSGVVSAANSLVGSKSNDFIGRLDSVTALSNGNYVVHSPVWDNGAVTDAGAVTWGSGTSGVSGTVSSANSLVGSVANAGVSLFSTTGSFDTLIASFPADVSGKVWIGSQASGFFAAGGSLAAGTGYVGVFGKPARPLPPGVDASASTVTLSGDLLLTINGNAANTSHDQLKVAGTVDLTSATLKLAGSYALLPADALMIVSATSRVGTFAGLADGDTITFGSQKLSVSYTPSGVILRPPPIRLTSLVIANGSAQRSMIKDITIAFGGLVNFPTNKSDAVILTRTGPGAPTGTVTVSVDTATLSTATQTIAKLTFSGAMTQFNSLIDGNYQLQVLGALLTDQGGQLVDADNNGTAGGTNSSVLHRLYGDANGDKTVNSTDFLAFRLAFLSPSVAFDLDGSGSVDASDFLAFRLNFLKTLP